MTMRRLASRSDAVLMDLRSFAPTNRGSLYELEQLLKSVHLQKVVFVVDATTDQSFLEKELRRLSTSMPPDSPNWSAASPVARLFPMGNSSRANLAALVGLLATGPERPVEPATRTTASSGAS